MGQMGPREQESGRPRGAPETWVAAPCRPVSCAGSARPPSARVTVSVVLVTRDDEARLPLVLARLPHCIDELVVVDRGSRDDTVAVAGAAWPGVRVLLAGPIDRGRALAAGLAAARGDITVCLEPDGRFDPAELPRHLARLLDGADCTAAVPLGRGLGRCLPALAARPLHDRGLHEVAPAATAVWSALVPELASLGRGGELDALLALRALRSGRRVAELPSAGLGWEASAEPWRPVTLVRGLIGARLHRSGEGGGLLGPAPRELPVPAAAEPSGTHGRRWALPQSV